MSHFHLGIDENGLGPRLGPLLVTAALAQVSPRGQEFLARPLPPELKRDLDDSKALVSCHHISLGEAWARVLVELEHPHAPLHSPAELLALLSLDSPQELRSPCPPSTRAQCWTTAGEGFQASEAELARIRAHAEFLEQNGVQLRAARSVILCVGRLNQLRSEGINRSVADLHAMERLILALQAQVGEPVEATCGKVGGMGQYQKFFGPLRRYACQAEIEGQAESVYQFPQLGRVRFARDADAHYPLVMLASLIGKYLRELLMQRITSYYRQQLPGDWPTPSGYHDPVTRRFVEQTESLRRKLALAPDCFERRSPAPSAPSGTARQKKPAAASQGSLFSARAPDLKSSAKPR